MSKGEIKENKVAQPVKNEKPKGKDGKPVPDELSEEDKALKEGLELAVTRLREDDTSLHKQALDHLVNEIKSSTSSMTSVPKPLKFLREHYNDLKVVFESWPVSHSLKRSMADMLSVLGMTMGEPGKRECLKYKLLGTQLNVSSWGHEYVRSLSGEISEEYDQRVILAAEKADEGIDDGEAMVDDLLILVDDIIPFQMEHNAEAEAVDLLIEVNQLRKLVSIPNLVEERNYERVCLYLIRSAAYISDPDELEVLYEIAFLIYKQQHKLTDALRVALKVGNAQHVRELFGAGANDAERLQMAHILARAKSALILEDSDLSAGSSGMEVEEAESTTSSLSAELLNEVIGNTRRSERFVEVVRELDLNTPKAPEDIYKAGGKGASPSTLAAPVDSARANLATTFVNAFVNAGSCKDKLFLDSANSENWLFKNKGHGMQSAAASLGMLMMWNIEEGLNEIDKFFHDGDDMVRSGACLGVGLIASGVRNDSDPALALLTDFLDGSSVASPAVKTMSSLGLGLAYAGAERAEVKELLESAVANTEGTTITEVSMAALSLGMVFVGTCDDDLSSVILQRLMESSDEELTHTAARFLCLGLGLLYLGKGEQADLVIEALRTIEHKRGKYAELTVSTCAYAGSGNVLKVQEMLRLCTDHLKEDAEHQAVAVLGIALTAAGEEIGTEMSLRTFEHLLHYGELPVKRVVPLALALLYVSNPEYSVVDQLSRLSHDADPEIAQCAILGLGLVSAGTNNARVAGLLRSLADFYYKPPSTAAAAQAAADATVGHMFLVRIAQGLNAAGKGLLSLSPFFSDRLLVDGPAFAGLLTVFHAALDLKNTLLDKMHYLLFFLAPAMNPRYLSLVSAPGEEEGAASVEGGNLVKASVRVGQAVETVGQAGRPKTITGFQTHTTPVLLGYKDRAEFANAEYAAAAAVSVMEGVILVKKVPVEQVAPEGSTGASASTSTHGN